MRVRFMAPVLVLAGLLLAPVASPLWADDFRVETEVFSEKEKLPVSENLTLFQNGVVYDFEITEPQGTTILDLKRGQIVLLNPARQVRASLSTEQLLQHVAEIQAQAQVGHSRLKFLAHPEFTTTYEAATEKLTLASDILTYNAQGLAPKNATAVARYREFADWSARLNSTRPGSLLPFSRLALNRGLAERNLVPSEVELTLSPESRIAGKKLSLRSKQVYTWRLLEIDQQKIARAGTQSTEFKLVSLGEFREFGKLADKRAAK